MPLGSRARSVETAYSPVERADLTTAVVDEITWFMREHKVSRADLARSMGVSPGRVSQVLSGDENLTLRTLSAVVAALGAELDLTLRPVDGPGGSPRATS